MEVGAPETVHSLARETLEVCDGVLARVWLTGPGDLCARCPMRAECPDRRECLHLVASAGTTGRTDGDFRRFPIGARRVGRVARDGIPAIERGDLAARSLADPAWLAVHGVRSLAAVPLFLAGRVGGVLAVFSRRFLTDEEVRLLALVARRTPLPPAAPGAGAAPPAPVAREEGAAAPERRTLAEIERAAIERVLAQTGGRISGPRGAATVLGLKPSTLASRMHRLGVRRPAK